MTTRSTNRDHRISLIYFIITAMFLFIFAAGCSGNKSMSSPNTYSPRNHSNPESETVDEKESKDDSKETDKRLY